MQDSNISRWWKDIKELGGLSRPGDWSSQLIGSEIPDEATLALKFNEFLGSPTAHFRPLEPLSPVFGPVPAHLYVSERTVYKTLRAMNVKILQVLSWSRILFGKSLPLNFLLFLLTYKTPRSNRVMFQHN